MEVNVQRDTKVTIQLDEIEAGKLMALIYRLVDFEKEEWALHLHNSLEFNGIREQSYEPLK